MRKQSKNRVLYYYVYGYNGEDYVLRGILKPKWWANWWLTNIEVKIRAKCTQLVNKIK